ncbi:hypothetical protein Tco_0256231 [Tanacetum coccineum]
MIKLPPMTRLFQLIYSSWTGRIVPRVVLEDQSLPRDLILVLHPIISLRQSLARIHTSYLQPAQSDMSEPATWQTVIGQPPPRGYSGSHMPHQHHASKWDPLADVAGQRLTLTVDRSMSQR